MKHLALLLAAVAASADLVEASDLLPVASAVVELERQVEIEDRLVGRVISARRSDLGFERGGRIDAVRVDVGELVEAGQELAVLDVRALRAEHRETEARLGAARADLRRVRSQLELAGATRRRQADLYERGVAAAQEHDEAVFAEQALQAQIGAAEAMIAATQAALARVEVALDLATLDAPFAGIVTARHLDEGSVAAPGAPVITLIDRHREVRIGVPIGKRDELEIGGRYEVEIEGGDQFCVLSRMVASVEPATRTVEAIFELPAESDAVDGAVARLRLSTRVEQAGFWLPTTALSEGRRGLWSVLVLQPVDDAHRVERREVQLLYVEADRAFVRGPLQSGERVAIAGLERVVPGQLVRAVDG